MIPIVMLIHIMGLIKRSFGSGSNSKNTTFTTEWEKLPVVILTPTGILIAPHIKSGAPQVLTLPGSFELDTPAGPETFSSEGFYAIRGASKKRRKQKLGLIPVSQQFGTRTASLGLEAGVGVGKTGEDRCYRDRDPAAIAYLCFECDSAGTRKNMKERLSCLPSQEPHHLRGRRGLGG